MQTQTGLSEFNTNQGGVKNVNDTHNANMLGAGRIPSQFVNFTANSKEKPMFLDASMNTVSPNKAQKMFK